VKADYFERAEVKRLQREEEFRRYGINPAERSNGIMGAITFYATDAEKLLRILRRAKKAGIIK